MDLLGVFSNFTINKIAGFSNWILKLIQYLFNVTRDLFLLDFIPFLTSLLEKLDSDTRVTVYIGATGIIIAIVIFIAEFISNQKHEVYKKLLLSKTKIQYQMIFMIVILGLIWVGTLIDINSYSLAYYLFQLLINVCIILSMFFILKIFSISIKLNTDELYLNNELDKYIRKITMRLNKTSNKRKQKHNKSREQFDKYIKDNSELISNDYFFNVEEKYIPVYPSTDGYISKVNYGYLNSIINNSSIQLEIDSSNIAKSEFFDNKGNKREPKIYFCKTVGDKVNKNFPIAYYKDLKKSNANNINKIFSMDKKIMYPLDNLVKIIDNLFDLAGEDKLNFDNNNRILNYYEYLCEIDDFEIVGVFFNKLRETYFEAVKEKEYRDSYTNFLYYLSFVSANKNRIEEFKNINSYITGSYYHAIKENKNNDYSKIAYNYANKIFIGQQYSYRKNKDYYYDSVMANLLNIIGYFLKIKEIDPILVLFDNIHFDRANAYEDEYDENDIVNFQFLLGIVYAILYNYSNFESSQEFDFSKIKKIIDKVKYAFFSYFDLWEFIVNFKLYNNKNSCVREAYERFEFDWDSEINKYKNSISGWAIDNVEVLKCMMYMFNIDFSNKTPQESDVDMKDKYYFENIIKKLGESTYIKLEEAFGYGKFSTDNIKTIVQQAIAIAEKKEKEYKKNHSLSIEKVEKFKNKIIEESKKTQELMKYVKITKKEDKTKKAFGMNQLIPRELFFEDVGGIESFASDYGRAFTRGINKELFAKLEMIQTTIDKSLLEVLKKIKKVEDYIIITNFQDYRLIDLEKRQDHVIMNEKKVDMLITNKIENTLIIAKKNLPSIEFYDLDDTYDNKNITDGLFFELRDLSNDKSARDEIIANSEWLKEKGSIDEQNEYLKQQCNIRTFMSFKIKVKPSATAVIIKMKNDIKE